MISKSVRISASFLLLVSLFFVSCEDDFYPKVFEVLHIKNNTADKIYVKYGFTSTIQNSYQDNIQLIDTMEVDGYYQFEDSLFSGLWMTESRFNELVSQLSIYRIHNKDTDYVNPKYYNKKSTWEHHKGYRNNLVSNRDELLSSENTLSICDSMFIN